MNTLYSGLLVCLLGIAYVGAEMGELKAERVPSVESNMESPRLIEEFVSLRDMLWELEKSQETSPDNNEIERVQAEYRRKTEEKSRLIEELKGVMAKLNHLRERLAESPNDQELKNETERVKADYHRKIQHYNDVTLPRSKRIMEGDMPPADMPWDRAHGGKVSVFFKSRGIELPVSDEEAEIVRIFLDDHVSEWLRGNQSSTEGLLNQIIFVGTVTIRRENGYSRTYAIVHGEGLRWGDCYLPLDRTYSDNSFYKIQSRYIPKVSKLPLDPEARKWMKRTQCK